MLTIDSENKSVSYDTFVRDIATSVVNILEEVRNEPEFINQSQAYSMFGRANVDRWRRKGKIEPCKRPGKVEYRTSELRALQRTKQDYFK